MAELGSAQRKHHFIYCCVIAGTCFEVTVLAWSKFAAIRTMNVTKMVSKLTRRLMLRK
jgi:hypothetical protein